jgi:hypothetical protein
MLLGVQKKFQRHFRIQYLLNWHHNLKKEIYHLYRSLMGTYRISAHILHRSTNNKLVYQ